MVANCPYLFDKLIAIATLFLSLSLCLFAPQAAISSSLSHPNICSTYTYSISEMKDTASKQEPVGGAIASPDSRLHLGYEVQLVLEYCDLGCLRTFLDSRGFYEDDLPTTDGSRRPCLYSILITARDISSAMTHVSCSLLDHPTDNLFLPRSTDEDLFLP